MVASMPRTAITTATARTTISAVSIMGFPPLFDALLGYLHQSHVSIITKASHKTFDQQLHLGAVVSIDLIMMCSSCAVFCSLLIIISSVLMLITYIIILELSHKSSNIIRVITINKGG